VRIDDTILPGCAMSEIIIFAVRLRLASRSEDAILKEAEAMLSGLSVSLQLATETSPGELKEAAVGALIPYKDARRFLRTGLSRTNPHLSSEASLLPRF